MRIELDMSSAVSSSVMESARQKAVTMTAEEALSDCNFYCKQDTGALIQSSLINSDFESGVLKWAEPYAEYQYTFPRARRDKNPNASPQWCARAEADFGDDWKAVFDRTYREEIGR